MRGILAVLLLLTATQVTAQKPGDVWRLLNMSMRADSTVAGVVHYTITAHEDSTKIGSKGSMTQADWPAHTKLVTPAPIIGDPARGLQYWRAECAECHTGQEGWDLAHFAFSDTTIVRRAVVHVDTQAAWDIVAHVRSLSAADTMTPKKIPYQPFNTVLPGDSAFAVALFGVDQWPANLTRDSLLRINALKVTYGYALITWSDEQSNYDWLPGSNNANVGQLPAGVRAAAANVFSAYYTSPKQSTAMVLARRLRTLAGDASIPDAPCTYDSAPTRYDAQACADLAKWVGSFLYVHMVKYNTLDTDVAAFTREFWEVGHLFHKAQQHQKTIPMRSEQIAAWMFLGWMWDYALSKQTLYLAGPLRDLGYTRHGSFHALMTQVRRPALGAAAGLACDDAHHLANFGQVSWMVNQMTQAYNEIIYRETNSMIPSGEKSGCVNAIRQAQLRVGNRAGAVVKAQLQPLADAAIQALLN